jgi:RNA polymerase sigma factor (sigma-70 family)
VDQYENLVWSVIRGFRLSEADALDVAQVTWLRAVENLDRIRDPERIGLWLATTAKRECMRLLERSKRSAPSDPQDRLAALASPQDLASEVENRAECERVLQALESLGGDCQQLLRLLLADPPCSYAEIAEILGISIGTIGARRQRCLSKLRAAMG